MILLLALATLSECDAAARSSGLDYRQCLGTMSQRADAEMAAQWRLALAAARREDRENRGENKPSMTGGLLESQRAWLRYRQAECTMIGEQAAGGTGVGEMYSECSIELTRERTELLRRRAQGYARYAQ
jgi:uncharacterized protein YecT (DUF1311 family)